MMPMIMMQTSSMNRMLAEDVNAPALRNPMNHLKTRRPRKASGRNKAAGWVDAVRAAGHAM